MTLFIFTVEWQQGIREDFEDESRIVGHRMVESYVGIVAADGETARQQLDKMFPPKAVVTNTRYEAVHAIVEVNVTHRTPYNVDKVIGPEIKVKR